jgi:TRAP transporter TAXI family solute receptor
MKIAAKVVMRAAIAGLIFAGASIASAQTMAVATNPQGSAFYAVGAAVAQVVSENTDMRLLVQPTSGSSENVTLLEQGDVEFAVLNTVELAWARAGDVVHDGKRHENLRLVSAMFQFPISIAVPADSDITSIGDLAGRRVPSEYTSHLTIRYILDALLNTAGLKQDDLEGLPVANYVQGMEALGDGRVEAAVLGPTSGTAREIESRLGGLRLLPVPNTPEALAAMREKFPGSQHHLLAASRNLPGVDTDTNVMAWSGFLAANADVPAERVRAIVEALIEHGATLASATPTLAAFGTRIMVEDHPVPYHDGAIAAYRAHGLMPGS